MEDKAIILQQYQLYIEMADRISQRRAVMNNFFVTLVSSLLAAPLIIIKEGITSELAMILIVLDILGILLCLVWWLNIKAYKQLNSKKFQLIHEIEQHLPLQLYEREWELLKQGKSKKTYIKLTVAEQYVPVILILSHIIMLCYFITFI